MKYCKVVRDFANKSGDWIFCDEQFRYLRKSSPKLFPWEQIHWEPQLRAMTHFRANQCLSKVMIGQPRRGDFEPPLSPFPGEPVGHFIQGGTAEAANTSTCASSVALNIPPPSAKTKAPNCEQTPLSSELQLQLRLQGNFLVTPVRVDRFEQLLMGYNQIPKQHLTNSFRFGFQINFTGEITSFEAPNLKSALQNPEILYLKLSKELDDGRIAGSFDTTLFPVFRT